MSRHEVMSSLDRVDPDLGIFIELDADAVLREAEAARGGRLAGVPIAVKDLTDTAGTRPAFGTNIFAENPAHRGAGGDAHELRIDDLRRAPSGPRCGRRRAAAVRGGDRLRQDEPQRVRVRSQRV